MDFRKLAALFLLLSYSFCISCDDNIDDIDGISPDLIGLSEKVINFSNVKDSAIIKTKGDWWWIGGIYYQDSVILVNREKDTINFEWITIIKKDKNTLFITVDDNRSKLERNLMINLQAGNYFDNITVNQK